MNIPHPRTLLNAADRLAAAVLMLLLGVFRVGAAAVDYPGDMPEMLINANQSWGELGYNVAAHATGVPGQPLRIGTNDYTKGLGHHANGSISLLLDGNYTAFDTDVGVQRQQSSAGSVIFRVYVDGEKKFDSGILRQSDGAKTVSIPLQGANELRLEVNDAGDGIICDVANWADARLTRSASAMSRPPDLGVDVAPFARVVEWDPHRYDGLRSDRLQEVKLEEVFLETELHTNRSGCYSPSPYTNSLSCIGLQWLNRRTIKQLEIEFAQNSPELVRVDGWFGESAWQGQWKPLKGEVQREGSRIRFLCAAKSDDGSLLQTRKIRWVLKSPKAVSVRKLSAFTRSRWEVADVVIEAEAPGGKGLVKAINGEITGSKTVEWTLGQPLRIKVRHSRPNSTKSDPTVLQFQLPSGTVAVGMEDVLANECVYVPDAWLFVAREPASTTLAEHKKKIAGRQTILDQVREMPDQTMAQAMAKTHNPVQKNGPVLLSLACDNSKFVMERNGTVLFRTSAPTNSDWFDGAGSLKPTVAGQNINEDQITRRLDGGWLPIPVISTERDGVSFTERVFVAPVSDPGLLPSTTNPLPVNLPSVCVVEFMVSNKLEQAVDPGFALKVLADSRRQQPFEIKACKRGFLVTAQGRALALVDTAKAGLEGKVEGSAIRFSGTLPPQSAARCVAYFAGEREQLDENVPWQSADLRKATEAYWNSILAPALQVETPDEFLNNLIRSSQVRCLIDARSEAEGQRVAAWIAAVSYGPLESEAHSIIRGMDLMGHPEFARRALDYFIYRYNTNGFLTTGYTVFGTGWHLWTLGEHAQLTENTEWLKENASEIARVGQWIIRQTEKTKWTDAKGRPVPEFGLMPPGVMADWNAFAYHFALNAYYRAALRQIGLAFQKIGRPEGAVFLNAGDELQENILRAYQWTQSQSPVVPLRNGTWVPPYPSHVPRR